ncbi:inositol monophosphatase [bacterium]|nr:inositol monophosphatase [bacterium]|tara:strand:+ start:21692 stop:22222 length:531 start_codon:yes stop_codon:yes gene_type:complete
MTKKIIIASQNPVKINAVKIAFGKMFSLEKFTFKGVSVFSGVRDQPMNNQETMTGAINRATNAKTKFQDADFWVGIEGGVEKINNQMGSFAWVVIKSNKLSGKARTSTFFLPKKVVELIDLGKELGEADDIVFGHTNSKQKNGAVGILTKNVITRKDYYIEAIILALIPFKNSKIY